VLARKDLRPALPEINCPTLILCGEGDAITPLEGASEIAQALPMAEFHSLQHAGHMLCWEQPEEVNNHLLKWLKRIRPHLGIAVTVF
jgi:pimeloyl-ACP methyl ester carboxylesterase